MMGTKIIKSDAKVCQYCGRFLCGDGDSGTADNAVTTLSSSAPSESETEKAWECAQIHAEMIKAIACRLHRGQV